MPSPTLRALVVSCSSLALAACNVEVAAEAPPADTATTPATGALLWSRAYGGPFDDSAGPLALTPDGHARFSATVTPLSVTGVESFALPLARFDHDGGIVVATRTALTRTDAQGATTWSQPVQESTAVRALDVATDGTGDVWVLGTFTGTVDFGDGLHTAHAVPPPVTALDPVGYDVFLARYH